MAKNKKKKNTRQDLEQQFGNGIAPISTKKTSAKNKKNTKKSTKKVDTMEETKKNKNVDTKPIAPVEIKKDDKFTIKTPEMQRTQEQEEAYNKKKSQATLNGQYIGKKAVSGVTTGLTGLVDAPLQTFQEGVEQGKGSSAAKNIIKGYVKSIDYFGLTNIPENAKELSEIATNDKLKTGQKIVKSGLAILNNNPVVQMIEGSGRLFKGLDKNAEKHVEKAREVVEKPSEKVSEWAEKDADKVDKWAKTVGGGAEVTTNMIPSIAASIITQNPNVGLAVMGVSAKGTSTREAEKKGATLSEANDIGFAKGAVEVLTEKMFSGFGKVFGKGALDDVAKEGLNRIIKNKGANYVAKRGMDILGEWFEETVSDLVDTYIDKNTTDPDATYTFKDWLETGKMTALSTIMLNGITGGYMPSTVIENNTELEKASQSENIQKIIEKELEERLNAEYNGKATAREIAQLQKEVIEDIQKGYISTDTIEKTLGGETYNKLDSINQEKNKIQEQIDELQKKADNNELSSLEEKQKLNDLKEQIKTIDDTEIRNQLNKEIQETIKNDIGLQESYKEVGRRKESYKVDLDSIQDEKQRAVYQKAMDSGVLNNSNKTHALVDMIAKISSEKGINFDFTNNEQLEKSGFGVNGRNINGYVTDSGITINLNSSKAINRIVGHELTHTFEGTTLYTELQDSLKDFLGSEWDNQVAKYKDLYKGVKNANIENELTSDLIGDYLFTDENYVRNLSTGHRNLFQKIYDEIKYLYNVATAGSKEKRQLEKVKRTFDKIYNETESKVTSDTKMSITEDSNGNKLTKEQQEYFKNSKVVDDNGNLKVMYNGGGDYTIFDNTKMSDQSKWGKGIYLTEDSNIARMYGDNVKEVYADIKNPINQTEKTISFDTYNELMQELYDEEADRYDYDMYDNDLDLLWDATNKGNWADYGEQLRDIVGVDGLIIEDSNPAERMAIAFNSNQIKNVSNENPTANADIRYDLSVSEANTTEDNEGRKLTKDQLNYFKDTKAVDNDGNLITVYHTTTNAIPQFNEFNPVGTPYYKFGDQVVNYYTNDKNMSGSYANQDYVMADTKKINSMDEVNSLLEEHNNNLNPNEKYDYNLEIVKDGDGYKLKVTSQPGAAASGEIEEFYPRIYENQTDLFKKIKNDIMTYKTIRNENGMAISKDKKFQYEGYVNITNPYVIDAEKRNWNQVISQSNEFIDELDERVPQGIKDNLTRLYQESANKSDHLRTQYNILEKFIRGTGEYLKTNKNTDALQKVLNRIGTDSVQLIADGSKDVLGVNTYYGLAEELENAGIIGKDTSKLIIDDFKIPESVQKWVKTNYNKKLQAKDLYPETNILVKVLGKNSISLKELYENSNKAYEEFDKYRMPNSYFMEQISSEGNNYLGNDLNDMFETRAEIMSPERVAEEIAEAASVGFSKPEMIRLWGTSKTTNDIVKEVIASNNDGSTNYDGVIIRNVYDYGGATSKASANDLYVTFNSNQFKAVDNTTPTIDPDIRYSLDIAPISKNFLTQAEQDELDGLRAVDNSGFSELTPEEQSRMYELENRANTVLDKKAEKMLRSASYKAINTATKVAQSYLDFDANEKKSFRNQMREFSNMTKDELVNADTYNKVKDIVSQYANREYTYFDDSVESVKKELRHTKIKISDELKNQITDYGDFVRDSRLLLRRNSGTSVDQVYQEYSDMYPGFFSNEVINEADQLEELNNFINHDFSVTEKYKLSDEDLRVATDLIYNKLLDNSLSQQDLIETEEILDKKVQKRTRAVVREELLNKMGITPELIGEGNDISAIDFARTDPIRVNEKVFGWKTGQLINDATVNFTKHQEAERMRFLNKERQEIKDLGIKARSKESELVQKYGEKQYVDKNNEVHPYTDAELNRDVKDAATREKIKNAARVLRQKYDTYIDRVNSVLTEMGYDEIPKRQDYMRHFVELNDKFSRWGLPFNKESMMAEDLPTDINGLTEFNRPGKSYFASANTRTGLQTTYDAITGIDGYLEGVSNLIYHTESIQRYRALTRFIRENYGREHGLDNIDLMTDEELADRIKDIQDNKLSKYVAWLDEQANSIAGKKGSLDRSIERMFGRRIYTALNTLKSQVGSNMTGFNVRSAMTNFASAIQGAAKTKKLALVKGTISTINNIIHNDGLIDKSDFLTRRFGSDSLAMKPWQKLSKAGQIFMEGTDYFTANQIWRSKYFENLDKGMSETQSIKNADDFAARIMGDRSKGSTAELFNSKTLGFLSQFQLEVNNQWSSLVHDNKIDIQKGNKTALGVSFELGQLFAASYMFNTMMKALTGSDVMIDPIDMLLKIFKPKDDDKDEGIVKRAQKVLGEFINQLPFANLVTGGGRIPISEAFTGAKTLGTKLMGGTDNYGNEISWGDVGDDLKESLAYWILPTGYGQIRKTVKGLSMYDDKLPIAGSYTDSGNLRFSAEDTPFGKIKAGLFGQYSSKYAQDYIDSGYKSINASKLDEMKDLDMNSTEYRDYREGLSAAGTSIEDKLNYISDLDVSDEDKTIMASNVAKKDIDMAEYKKFGSYDEFNYAQKNPAKYEVMKLVGGYDTYKNYEKAISEITADYDRNGKAITNSRKNKVIKYVNSLNLTRAQKAMLIKEQYPSFTQYDSQIASYVNNQNMSFIQKAGILKQLGFKAYDRQIINYIRENYRTTEEQQEELEKLGFKIYNYNGKTYVR